MINNCAFLPFEERLTNLEFVKKSDAPAASLALRKIKDVFDRCIYLLADIWLALTSFFYSDEHERNRLFAFRERFGPYKLAATAAIFGHKGLSLASELEGTRAQSSAIELLRAQKMAPESLLSSLKETLEAFATPPSDPQVWLDNFHVGQVKAIPIHTMDHAMALLIRKTDHDRYAVECINTGAGMSHHLSRERNAFHKLYSHSYLVENVEEKKLAAFLSICKLVIPSIETLYKGYLPTLGPRVNDLSKHTFDFAQVGGTCVASAIMTVAKKIFQKTHPDSYKNKHRELRVAVRLYFLQELVSHAKRDGIDNKTALVIHELAERLLKPANACIVSQSLQQLLIKAKSAAEEVLNSNHAPDSASDVEKLIHALQMGNAKLFLHAKKAILKQFSNMPTVLQRMEYLRPLFNLDPYDTLGISSRSIFDGLSDLVYEATKAADNEKTPYLFRDEDYELLLAILSHKAPMHLEKTNPLLAAKFEKPRVSAGE